MDDETHRQLYVDAIQAARDADDDAFQNWFNKSGTFEEGLRRGYWDFAFHVLTREVAGRLADPGSPTALEIGYGGGRLLNAAACFFGTAIGIDVHHEASAVAAVLAGQGQRNVELIRSDGRTVPLPDESVDFVYSFIVLEHLPSLSAFESYVSEAHRVLRPRGVAQLYFGRLAGKSRLHRFREIPGAQVNHVSLALSPWYAPPVPQGGILDRRLRRLVQKRARGQPALSRREGFLTVVKGS